MPDLHLSNSVYFIINIVINSILNNRIVLSFFAGIKLPCLNTFIFVQFDLFKLVFETNGEVMLNKEQFELLRKTILAITIAKKDIPEEPKENENMFFEMKGFGKICLN